MSKFYYIHHDGKGEDRSTYWNIYFGNKLIEYDDIILSCRAKSRSKEKTQMLLDHMNELLLKKESLWQWQGKTLRL